jgi:DNA-binding CsgD family transcriptional regulator
VRDRIAHIPEAQAKALEAALALGAPIPADRFTAAAATLSILAAAAEDALALLCLIDDAQWLDTDSAEALVFACRRLQAEKVVVLFATRDIERGGFAPANLPELRLVGLEPRAANAILEQTAVDIAPSVAMRLVAVAGGNPLALLELPTALTEAQRGGHAPLDEPLPVGPNIERAFLGRARALPAETQRALLLAAACDGDDLKTLLTALEAAALSAKALESAEQADLLTVNEGRFSFRHPLVRSALYHAASAPERRAAHRAIADALTDEAQRARRTWHMAATAVGPDERTAAALEDVGHEARSRGGYATAATTFERAAQLSTQKETRARRLLAAANASWLAGQSDRANLLLSDALNNAVAPLLRADIEQIRGRVLMWTGSVRDAYQHLHDDAERIEPLEPARAAVLMAEAVLPSMMAGDVRLAVRTAERAMTMAAPLDGFPAVVAALAGGQALMLAGQTSRARALLEGARKALSSSDPFGPGAILAQIASCFIWIEEYEQAWEILMSVTEAARTQGAVVILPFALSILSEYNFRLGNFSAAYAEASESVTLAIQTNQETEAAFSFVTLARSEAVLGNTDDCRAHTLRALELAEQVGAGAIRTYAASVLGLLDLGLGRPDQALLSLSALPEMTIAQGLEEPGTVQWAPDLIESYAQLGKYAEARAALATFTRQAERTSRTWALAAAARCRGLLASGGQIEREFEEALRWHDRTPTPFERARTELSYGERLRRVGLRRKARERLRAALSTFERLGSTPWAERAAAELRASGESLGPRVPVADERLTAQELQVALIVAGGATNREAAAQLFLSPKTIEFHLGHIFRKLGLRSRTEVARHFARQGKEALIALLFGWEWADLLCGSVEILGMAT